MGSEVWRLGVQIWWMANSMDGWMDRDLIVDEDGTSKSSACQIELRLDFTKEC